MLPYTNPHYHFGISQEPPHPKPVASGFPMPAPPPAHLDHQHHYTDYFFPGHDQFNSEMLEAVLRPTRVAAVAPEREASVVVAAAQQGGKSGGGQGHARARKRPFRTDRHSKIRTAQGVRDRRMRLSIDVARDFFALQDRLGFDKASKTVDWLLTQSKPAIDRLSSEPPSRRGGTNSAMSSSPTTAVGIKDAAAAAGSGKGGGSVEKVGSRNGGSLFMEHSCELDHIVPAALVLGEYYYGFSEMMSNKGGEGDDAGEYDEDGDFLDGMQY